MLIKLNYRIVEDEDAIKILKQYEELMQRMDEFDEYIFQTWKESVPKQIEDNLDQPLFYRNIKTQELYLNFHPQVLYYFCIQRKLSILVMSLCKVFLPWVKLI